MKNNIEHISATAIALYNDYTTDYLLKGKIPKRFKILFIDEKSNFKLLLVILFSLAFSLGIIFSAFSAILKIRRKRILRIRVNFLINFFYYMCLSFPLTITLSMLIIYICGSIVKEKDNSLFLPEKELFPVYYIIIKVLYIISALMLTIHVISKIIKQTQYKITIIDWDNSNLLK